MTHFRGAIHIKKEKENREKKRLNVRDVLRYGLQHVSDRKREKENCNYVSCDSCGTQKRQMSNVCTIAIVYFLPATPLSPCYEAIHHKAQDSEEIILYIEGQPCHLVGSLEGCVCVCVGFNLPPYGHSRSGARGIVRGCGVFLTFRGRRKGGGGVWEGGRWIQEVTEGFPLHRRDWPPQGEKRGWDAVAKSHRSDSNSSAPSVGVRAECAALSFCFLAKFSPPPRH